MNRIGFHIGRVAATLVYLVGHDSRPAPEVRERIVQEFRKALDMLPEAKRD
jgi:hypothetical protein